VTEAAIFRLRRNRGEREATEELRGEEDEVKKERVERKY